jgi:hypothetical protein
MKTQVDTTQRKTKAINQSIKISTGVLVHSFWEDVPTT